MTSLKCSLRFQPCRQWIFVLYFVLSTIIDSSYTVDGLSTTNDRGRFLYWSTLFLFREECKCIGWILICLVEIFRFKSNHIQTHTVDEKHWKFIARIPRGKKIELCYFFFFFFFISPLSSSSFSSSSFCLYIKLTVSDGRSTGKAILCVRLYIPLGVRKWSHSSTIKLYWICVAVILLHFFSYGKYMLRSVGFVNRWNRTMIFMF